MSLQSLQLSADRGVEGLGFRGLGFRVEGLGFRGLGVRVLLNGVRRSSFRIL